MIVKVTAIGTPRPKGSLQRGKGRSLYYPKGVSQWERTVQVAAIEAMKGKPVMGGVCRVGLRFFRTPYATGKSPGRVPGDVDKLARCVLDSFTGVVYEDDVQVVSLLATKQAVEPKREERVEATICDESDDA